ncbi:MAG: 3-phosphoglycerate dehydrogenase [Bacteroidetes bacterium]|jgi:D-3-phosphoglycerate dehydrogenase|nr:3-phosphoglycerate dehydrogenase [Bacteroidota bacterium]MCK4406643.1 3-phosphoglycerate dehydrogenase [Bacteroidales bacterium]
MTKVLIATVKPFAPAAVNQIKEIFDKAGYETILLEKYPEQSDFVKAVEDVDALIIRSDKATKEVIDSGKNLKIIVRAGAGYDNIDLEAATDKGVVAMNTPGQNSNAVAELALGMMVYLVRNQFNGTAGTELRGKKLGIHAYGNVGKYVAEIAKGFGMEIYAYDPFIPKETIEKDGVKVLDSAEELYKTCQYVSVHIPANEKTKNSINYELLSLMPKGATLVNTARKEVVCEESLLKIFADRNDFKYISDIAPDCKDEIAEKFEGRFFFTPKKMGAQTSEANINAGIAAATQIINYLEKGDKTYQVN